MGIHKETVDLFMSFYGLARKKPDIHFLNEIYTSFFHIPYENVTKIIKANSNLAGRERFRLPDELIKDHIRLRAGGTCFSLSYALYSLLIHLGFECYLVSADIQGRIEAHVAVIAIVNDTKFLIDPGFTIPNVIEVAEDRTTYGHNPLGRVKLEYTGVGRLFNLSNRNRKDERFQLTFRDMPMAEDRFMELWSQTFSNGSLDTISICKVVKNCLYRCKNEVLTEFTPDGKFQKSISHNFTQTIEHVFNIPGYLTHEAYSILKEKQGQKQAVG